MKKSFPIWAAAACMLVATMASAATPDQVQREIATLTAQPKIPEIKARTMHLKLLPGEPERKVMIIVYPNPFKDDGSRAISIFVHDSSSCGYNMADDTLTGVVVESTLACSGGRGSGDGAEFFKRFGGAQALFDKIISEALK